MFVLKPFKNTGSSATGSGISSLLHFFSRKQVSVICFILAIVIKTAFTWYFMAVETDKLFQAMAGKNLVEGHGITIKQVHVNNLSEEHYEPLAGWPPGYSVLTGFIYAMVNDLDMACFIVDVVFIVLYLLVLRKLLKQLYFPTYLINLFILFHGCTITACVTYSCPTDFLTLVLTMYSCSLLMKIFKKKNAAFETIQLAVVNAVAAWFRYMYLPVMFVIPVFLLWNGWFKKDKRLLRYGAGILLIAIVSCISLLLFQVPYSKVPGYVLVGGKGMFWSNLLLLHPVLFSSVINTDFYCMQLSLLTGINYVTWIAIMRWITVPAIALLLPWFFTFSFKKKWIPGNGWDVMLMTGGLISMLIVLVLAFMSVTHNSHLPSPENFIWTYLGEERYFVFLQFFIFIVAAKWLFLKRSAVSILKKWLQWVFLLLLSIEIVHGIYFLKKNFTFDRKNNPYAVIDNEKRKFIEHIITENKKKNIDVVVVDKTLGNRSVLLGGKGLFEPAELNLEEIKAGKPTILLAVVSVNKFSYYKTFLNKKGVKPENKIGDNFFYSYAVKAD